MSFRPENPLFVQGDHTLLLEVDNPRYEETRDRLARFAELIKSYEEYKNQQRSQTSQD